MNSRLCVTLGASGLSLIAGYFLGHLREPSDRAAFADSFDQESVSTHPSFSERESDPLNSKKYATRPTSSQGRAEYAVRLAQEKFDQSKVLGTDFGTFAEVWNTLDGFTSQELRNAMTTIDSRPTMSESEMRFRLICLTKWGAVDGQSAAEYVLKLKSSDGGKVNDLRTCLASWINTDLVTADLWYEANKTSIKQFEEDHVGFIKNTLVEGLAKRDINAAFDKIDFNNSGERQSSIQTMASLAAEDCHRDKVIEKVLSLEDEQLKHDMLALMISTITSRNLDTGSELIDSLRDSDPEKFLSYQASYVMGIENIDPKAALEYAKTEIADPETRMGLLKGVFARFVYNDELAAQDWLNTQSFESNDAFYARASILFCRHHPEKAMGWALKIGDDDTRTQEVMLAYQQWTKLHEAGAQQWLNTLDEESQAAILEGVDEKD
ncbi:hypothetical protein [Rubritalea sp.]|uniref:hypothetical protein n=1 Tax=Rubritalea sp. TaxID=2109375 RepID=UPI003EF5CC68